MKDDSPIHETNPFLEDFTIPFVRVIHASVPLNKENLEKHDYYDVEQTRATRWYRKTDFDAIKGLHPSTCLLVLYIMYNIGNDAVDIALDEKTLVREVGMSVRTIRTMKKDLVRNNIIAKRTRSRYWINPRFFASESRLHLYPDNIKKVATIRKR